MLSGQVRVGPGSCVLHGAVVSADGGPVDIGANCVIIEHAVLRATSRHPLTIADHVLAGPHCYLTGCTVGDQVFIATGAMVFNGARIGRASNVALGGAVHVGCVVPPQTRIPIGWVAVGDPARLYPPGQASDIRAGLEGAGPEYDVKAATGTSRSAGVMHGPVLAQRTPPAEARSASRSWRESRWCTPIPSPASQSRIAVILAR